MKFIKKQLMRVWNLVKFNWQFLLIEFIEDGEFTIFGKYLIGGILSVLLIFWSILLIVFSPIYLVSMKYDDDIGM